MFEYRSEENKYMLYLTKEGYKKSYYNAMGIIVYLRRTCNIELSNINEKTGILPKLFNKRICFESKDQAEKYVDQLNSILLINKLGEVN